MDAVIIGLERISTRLKHRRPGESSFEVIATATAAASRPVLFSVLVILVAFVPLFTMEGVPGRIFAPMSIAYGFALVGAQLFALIFAPVLASVGGAARTTLAESETLAVRVLHRAYGRMLPWLFRRRRLVLAGAGAFLVASLVALPFLGGEFMPKLEEGNLWILATLPTDISFEEAVRLAGQIRGTVRQFPEAREVVSHVGRPDDGTDPSTFNNVEVFCDLKPPDEWPRGEGKEELIRRMDAALSAFPGISFNFSQNMQDNVEEAMSGVKGENSLKLFGDDIAQLARLAPRTREVMAGVPGVDLGVFKVTGQPNLLVSIDRAAAGRYGLSAADPNSAVGAAVGGATATEILEGDRRFDFVVRYTAEFRRDAQALRDILVATPDGGRVPLGQVASVELSDGAFNIYRENGQRFIPIKFSVRGRDLASTVQEAQARLAAEVRLPDGYHYEWAGEYDNLRREQRRLMVIIPVSLLVIGVLLYLAFASVIDALIVIATLPAGAAGGVCSLLVTGTPFSISAAVGFASVLGVGTLAALVFLSAIRSAERAAPGEGAIEQGAIGAIRPVVMACLAAGLGLLPAAASHAIGVQAQQPLARVVVGGMIATSIAIPLLMPLLVRLTQEMRGRKAAVALALADSADE